MIKWERQLAKIFFLASSYVHHAAKLKKKTLKEGFRGEKTFDAGWRSREVES